MFELPFEFVTPDVVVAELDAEVGATVTEHSFEIVSTGPEHEDRLAELRAKYQGPSDADLYALLHASLKEVRLLTGDHHLRRAAELEVVEISGLLWLLDEIHHQDLADGKTLARALQAIIAGGARLPADECRKRIDRWTRR